jgi:hypothetical protein
MRQTIIFMMTAATLAASALGFVYVNATPIAPRPTPAIAAPPVMPGGGPRFELSGTGKIIHCDGPEVPGKAPFVTTVNAAKVASAIMGNEPSTSGQLETDAGGKSYIFFDSTTNWRLSVDPNGNNPTQLVGQTDGKGGFMMAGTHALSNTRFLLTGKVTFAKGTLNPTKITGKIMAVSSGTEHYGTGNFAAKLAP